MKNKKLFAILTLVCFMFTLMPVAAFAASAIDEQQSYIYLKDTDVKVGKEIEVELDLSAAVTETVTVWFEEAGYEDIAVKAVESVEGCTVSNGLIAVPVNGDYAEFSVKINRAGEFKVYAVGAGADADLEKAKKVALRTQAGYDVVTVGDVAANTAKYYIKYNGVNYTDAKTINLVAADIPAKSNGIAEKTVTFDVFDKDNNAVYAKDIKINGTSAIDVNDIEVLRSGKVSFDYTVAKAGTHKIYVTVGDYNATFKLDTRDSEADEIEVAYTSQTPVNIASANSMLQYAQGLGNWLVFKVYDENGSEVDAISEGITGVADAAQNYVTLIEQPADSDLKSSDFKAVYHKTSEKFAGNDIIAVDGWTIIGKDASVAFEEEGTYTFRVALDNGNSAKASITVKEAGDPVRLNVAYDADSVQIGGEISPKAIVWLDKNFVSTSLTAADYKFAVTGAAVEKVEGNKIIVKDDEKYVGSVINVTVVDEENDLVATKALTVVAEGNELVFGTTAAPVDSNTLVTVSLVDENGKAVTMTGTSATTASAYLVVLDKPATADVTAEVKTVNVAKGQFTFEFSCDTVGVVKLQAVMQVNDATDEKVVRYYTGVGEIKVGATGIEDVVVMSINSNQVVVNDAVKTIDAAPIVKDARTFVPFRALAEAFGATVEFDAATQAVVAELDGTTVVMTIGDKAYTVNGVAKTADVAPFISDSRTMVPVRFVAEAFGITVTPTYDDNGATADILFAK